MLFKRFRKKTPKTVDLIDFSRTHVSTGQVGGYIKKLYEEEKFLHIGYRYANINGSDRFILYTLPGLEKTIQYFKDRCPAMIEEECRKIDVSNVDFKINKWDNGFEEVSP